MINQQKPDFKTTVTQHLKAVYAADRGKSYNFSFGSVASKLNRLADVGSRIDCYKQGSTSLPALSDKLRQEIKNAVIQYTEEHWETRYNDESSASHKQPSLEAKSAANVGDDRLNVQADATATVSFRRATQTVNSGWYKTTALALWSWLDFCIMNGHISFDDTICQHLSAVFNKDTGRTYKFTKAATHEHLRKTSFRTPIADCRTRGSKCLTDISPEMRQEIENNVAQYTKEHWEKRYAHGHEPEKVSLDSPPAADSLYRRPDVAASITPPQTRSDREKPAPRVTLASKVAVSTVEQLQATLTRKNLEIETLRSKWQHEVDDLRDKLSQSERSELALQAENQHLIIARQQREAAGKDPLEHELFRMTDTIWALNKRVHEMQKLASFADPREGTKKCLQPAVVDEALDTIASELESVTCGRNINTRLLMPKAIDSSDLVALFDPISGVIAQEPEDSLNRLHDMVGEPRARPALTT